MYNIIYETSHQSRFNVGYWMLGVGALGRPGGMVWGGRREEGSGWGTHVYLWWIHFDVWQNQYNIVKLKNKIKKNLYYAHGLEKLIFLKWSYYQDNQQIQCNLYQNTNDIFIELESVQFSCSVVSNSLQPHGLQHSRLPCPSPTPRSCSNPCLAS